MKAFGASPLPWVLLSCHWRLSLGQADKVQEPEDETCHLQVSLKGRSALAAIENQAVMPAPALAQRVGAHKSSIASAHARARLEFLHIPKNAGYTIEEASREQGILWGKYNPIFNQTHRQVGVDGVMCSKWHIPLPMLNAKEAQAYSNASLFCVIRNPYDRIVSEYRWRADGLVNGEVSARILKKHGFIDDGVTHDEHCSVEGLNYYVQRVFEIYEEGHVGIDDCHIIPQSKYIWDEDGNQVCKHILRLEDDLNSAFNSLMEAYDYPVRLTKANAQHVTEVCANVTRDSLSPAARQMLQRVWADDFQKLGYVL